MTDSTRAETGTFGGHTRRIGFADILGDGFYAGAIGGAMVALFFLAVDALRGVPLFTPSLVGSVLLGGAQPRPDLPVDLVMVALYSLVHGAAFVAFGTLCAWILAHLHETPDLPLIAIACFVALELGSVVGARLLEPALAGQIGHGHIAAANLLAAIGMAVWLRRFARHQDDED
jgi:hypothetical protein